MFKSFIRSLYFAEKIFTGHHRHILYNNNREFAFLLNFIFAFSLFISLILSFKIGIIIFFLILITDYLIHLIFIKETKNKLFQHILITFTDVLIFIPFIVEIPFSFFLKRKNNNEIENWYGNVIFKPDNIFQPKNILELQEILKNNKNKIRCVSGNNVYNESVKTKDTILDLKDLRKNIILQNDKLIVSGNITIEEIDNYLIPFKRMILCPPEIKQVTAAGAFLTLTHGTTTKGGFFFEEVEAIEVITSNGELRIINSSDYEFKFWCGTLGINGIVISLTIKTYPMKKMLRTVTLLDESKIVDVFEQKHHFENFAIMWLPLNKKCLLISIEEKPEENKFSLLFLLTSNFFINLIVHLKSQLSGQLNVISAKYLLKFADGGKTYDWHSKLRTHINAKTLFKNLESEWYFPEERLQEMIAFYGEFIRDYYKKYNFNNFAGIYFRPINHNIKIPVMPYQGRLFGVFSPVGSHQEEFINFIKNSTKFLYDAGGVAHNGKVDYHSLSLKQESINQRISYDNKQIDELIDYNKKIDPEQVFSNDFIKNWITDVNNN